MNVYHFSLCCDSSWLIKNTNLQMLRCPKCQDPMRLDGWEGEPSDTDFTLLHIRIRPQLVLRLGFRQTSATPLHLKGYMDSEREAVCMAMSAFTCQIQKGKVCDKQEICSPSLHYAYCNPVDKFDLLSGQQRVLDRALRSRKLIYLGDHPLSREDRKIVWRVFKHFHQQLPYVSKQVSAQYVFQVFDNKNMSTMHYLPSDTPGKAIEVIEDPTGIRCCLTELSVIRDLVKTGGY